MSHHLSLSNDKTKLIFKDRAELTNRKTMVKLSNIVTSNVQVGVMPYIVNVLSKYTLYYFIEKRFR